LPLPSCTPMVPLAYHRRFLAAMAYPPPGAPEVCSKNPAVTLNARHRCRCLRRARTRRVALHLFPRSPHEWLPIGGRPCYFSRSVDCRRGARLGSDRAVVGPFDGRINLLGNLSLFIRSTLRGAGPTILGITRAPARNGVLAPHSSQRSLGSVNRRIVRPTCRGQGGRSLHSISRADPEAQLHGTAALFGTAQQSLPSPISAGSS